MGLVDLNGDYLASLAAESVPLPADSGVKSALARSVVNAFFSDQPCFLYIGEHGVFESAGLPFLFEGFRSLRTAPYTVAEMPGTLTTPEETEDLTGLLALALYFIWDVLLVNDRGSAVFYASHDEWYTLTTLDEALGAEVEEFLAFHRR